MTRQSSLVVAAFGSVALALVAVPATGRDCPMKRPGPPPMGGSPNLPAPYAGPAGQVDPTGRRPPDTTPPTPPPPSTTGSGGNSGYAPGMQGGSTTPRTGASGGRSGGAAARGKRRSQTESLLNWKDWWWNNQFRFLDFGHASPVMSGSSDFFLGAAGRQDAREDSPISEKVMRERVIPALVFALESPERDIRGSAVMALGRIAEGVPIDRMAALLHDRDGQVRQAAVLALGDAGSPARIYDLTKASLDRQESPTYRGLAMISLGLVGSESSIATLREVAQGGEKSEDLRCCALVALSLIPCRETRDYLREVAADPTASENLRALALCRLARICSGSPTRERLDDGSAQVRRSAVIGLGLADADAPGLDDTLERIAAKDRDGAVRAFACIALGERKGPRAKEILLDALEAPDAALHAFAVLGLGLLGDASAAPTVRDVLVKESHDPDLRAAAAVALGLLKDRAALPALARIVADEGSEPTLRGFGGLAIGMIGDRTLLPALEDALRKESNPWIAEPLGKGVALLGCRATSTVLLDAVAKASNDWLRATLIEAIGRTRDQGYVEPLLAVLADEKAGATVRSFAAVALGLLGDRTAAPRITAITNHRNYMVPAKTIDLLTSYL